MLKELNENDFIVSKTDTRGIITYVNKIFIELSEYTEEELIGKPHNILRHPDMPKAIFELLWKKISNKEEIFAYVINKTKEGNEYWVYANVTASLDINGRILGYYSVRRKAEKRCLDIIKPIYKKMLEIEKREGTRGSINYLNEIISEKGIDYDEFINTL